MTPALALVHTLDSAAVRALASAVGRCPPFDRAAVATADHLAKLHVALLGLLYLGSFVRGRSHRFGLAVRMSAALGVTIGAVHVIGRCVVRARPFARHDGVTALIEHGSHRSFPSRHAACAATMAAVAAPTAPILGTLLGVTGVLLGVSRVYAGLHYPSDVVGGWLVGTAVGRLVRLEWWRLEWQR